MSGWLRRHKVVLVYVGLVAIVVIAMLGYTRHGDQRLDRADRISCSNRRILIQNQRLVLVLIRRNLAYLLASQPLSPADRHYFAHSVLLLGVAQARLNQTKQCPESLGR